MKLTNENVLNIFKDCLTDETSENKLLVEGLVTKAYFNPDKLEASKSKIISMLDCLHPNFKSTESGGGGGWSFSKMCNDKNDEQWTGLHMNMEMLVMLGIGIKKVEYLAPRELWNALPLGLPYIVIK
jgi:hypothetical protein